MQEFKTENTGYYTLVTEKEPSQEQIDNFCNECGAEKWDLCICEKKRY